MRLLERELSEAIRENYMDIGAIPLYVHKVSTDKDGYFQCEVELEIPETSPVGNAYFRKIGYSPEGTEPVQPVRQAPQRETRRQNTYTDDAAPSRQRTNETMLSCPKCGSTNTNVQMVSETNLKTKHHSIFWWVFIGWWWLPIKWIFFTVPALVVKLFRPKRYKTTTTHSSRAVCQNCGYHWQTY